MLNSATGNSKYMTDKLSYKTAKYLFKYITKGPDYADANLQNDEIKDYINGRYLRVYVADF